MTDTMKGIVVVALTVPHNGLNFDGQINSDGVKWQFFNAIAPNYYTLHYFDVKLRRSD